MTAVKIESIYTGTKEVLTSFVGDPVGASVAINGAFEGD